MQGVRRIFTKLNQLITSTTISNVLKLYLKKNELPSRGKVVMTGEIFFEADGHNYMKKDMGIDLLLWDNSDKIIFS